MIEAVIRMIDAPGNSDAALRAPEQSVEVEIARRSLSMRITMS